MTAAEYRAALNKLGLSIVSSAEHLGLSIGRAEAGTTEAGMCISEQHFVGFAFFLVGVVVGYVTFLIFRISVRQGKFQWAGALSVITTLAGGGFLSYLSQQMNFAAYSYGFFVGFVLYFGLLQTQRAARRPIVTGSQAAPGAVSQASDDEDEDEVHPRPFGYRAGLGSELAESPRKRSNVQLTSTLLDSTEPIADRVRALLALRTEREILDTDFLRGDLNLSNSEVGTLLTMLLVPVPTSFDRPNLHTVEDLIGYVENSQKC